MVTINLLLSNNSLNLKKNINYSGNTCPANQKNSYLCANNQNKQFLPKCNLTGSQIVRLYNKQSISFKGSERNFPKSLFPVGVSNEDAFDRRISQIITTDPDKKSNLEVLVKERTGFTQKQLNQLLVPENINKGILGEIVSNRESVLHCKALDEYHAAMEKSKEEGAREFEEIMARVDYKLNEEISKSFQITQATHSTITNRKSLSSQERDSISDHSRKVAEKMTAALSLDRRVDSKNKVEEDTKNLSSKKSISAFNLYDRNRSKTHRESINKGEQKTFEKSKQKRLTNILENSYTKLAEQMINSQAEQTNSNTVISSITSRGINHSIAAQDIAQLNTSQSRRMFAEKEILAKFTREIESANLIFLLKQLIKRERIHPSEVAPMISKDQEFAILKINGDGYASKGKHSTAVNYYQKALTSRIRFLTVGLEQDAELAKDDFVIADIYKQLGKTKLAMGLPNEAEQHYLEAARIKEGFINSDPSLVSQSQQDLGHFYISQGNIPEAEKRFDLAMRVAPEYSEDKRIAIIALMETHKLTGNSAAIAKLLPIANELLNNEEIIEYTQPLLTHENPEIKLLAIETLGNTGKHEVIQHITPLLTHEDEATRNATMKVWGKVGKPEDAELLRQIIDNESESSSILASETYINLVKPSLDHEDSTTRHKAIDAILSLGEKAKDEIIPTKTKEITKDILAEIESVSQKPFITKLEQQEDELRRSTSAIDITRIVDSFGIESLSKGLDSILHFITFKEQHKVSNSRLAISADSHLNQSVKEGHHEAVATLYNVWANYHKQAGENELAISLEHKAVSLLEEAVRVVKK